MLSLNNLKKSKGSAKKRERLGRGNATGSGNYSTRGMKGQRARSGGKSGLALRSVRSYLLGVPKVRGFRSLNNAKAVVNLGDLEKSFSSGEVVNARAMLKAGLIKTIDNGVKVLANGKISKNITVEANAYSAGAKEKIEAAGGKAIVVSNKKAEAKDTSKKTKVENK
ncbi:50S ribosomal protein L15 [Candidatus Parcubacteria bacterium]|nr:MAG: 50S ribosomal protein L15 [Candidatus Parcubacteria bacterium]